MSAEKTSWALVPFWTDDGIYTFIFKVAALKRTVAILKTVVDRVLVVLDGVSVEVPGADRVIRLPMHLGKAEAVREGLRFLLGQVDAEVIVQCDADLDQNPADAQLLLERYCELRSDGVELPILLIGDRYPTIHFEHVFSRGDRRIPFYRHLALWVSKTFAEFWGMRVRDVVSGFRLYNRTFAERFLARSRAQKSGVEVEMVVCAYLMGAVTDSVTLSYSRPRDPFTRSEKVGENAEAILLHREEIVARDGLPDRLFMSLVAKIRRAMEERCSPPVAGVSYLLGLAVEALVRVTPWSMFYLYGWGWSMSYAEYKQTLVHDRSPLGDKEGIELFPWMELFACYTIGPQVVAVALGLIFVPGEIWAGLTRNPYALTMWSAFMN